MRAFSGQGLPIFAVGCLTALLVSCGNPSGTPSRPPAAVPASELSSSLANPPPPSWTAPTSPGTTARPADGPTGAPQPLRSDATRGPAADSTAAGTTMADFGAKFLLETRSQQPDQANLVISPYSLYTVLAMARAGADSDTAAQLDALLGGDQKEQAGAVTAIDQAVAAALASGAADSIGGDPDADDTRPFEFDAANAVWKSPDLLVRNDFVKSLASGFGAGVYEMDFRSDPDKARGVVNDWVAANTGELIKDLLGAGSVTSDTQMILANAVHLEAPWAVEFATSAAPQSFSAPSGDVKAAFIDNQGSYKYAAGTGWKSVTIPYRGGGMAMTIVLPEAGQDSQVWDELPAVLETATAAGQLGEVSLSLPAFKVETSVQADLVLKSLGVQDLFDIDRADLSGIGGDPGQLWASSMAHKAVIEVDEKGTEAAAATAMVVTLESMPPVPIDFTVDRPFFYVVHDTLTGAPLFLGHVSDPTT